MSTQTPQPPPPPPPPLPHTPEEEVEIRIISHSNLFYWWPLWAVGYLLGILTLLEGTVMAVVPHGTKPERAWQVKGPGSGQMEERDVLVVPDKKVLPPDEKEGGKLKDPDEPRLHMSPSSTYGVFFALTLILIILITNVPLRGMWSFMVVVLAVLIATIFALLHWWETIFGWFHHLDIRINAGGYFFISTALLIVWLVTLLLFDRQIYMIFTPGQLKVRQEIGGGEKAYDTSGMTIEKQRSDLFRHWILGIGSGDLIVNTSGAHVQHFELPNVLFVGKKVHELEDMLREKAVVRGR
jgi:hypothetical protein